MKSIDSDSCSKTDLNSDSKSCLNSSLEKDLIEQIQRQTNYTYLEAREKLVAYNNDSLKVIKEYLGIVDKPKESHIHCSLNQAIYKEIREKINICKNL
jgi:hypothetical protein